MDRHRDVQLATIKAVGGWSIEEAGELFLTGARSMHVDVRHRATAMLAQRGISYSGFNPEARPDNQSAQYQELVQAFRDIVGFDPMLDSDIAERPATTTSAIRQTSATVPGDATIAEVRRSLDDWSNPDQRELIQRRLTAHGTRLMPMIDHLMTVENRHIPETLDRVFAEVDPTFREIERLKSNDLGTLRGAARELARSGATNTPSKLAARRIIDLTVRHNDTEVITLVPAALRNADPNYVAELARPLLQSQSEAIRRLGCELLMRHGSSADVPLLHESLRDSSRAVVWGALMAIDALWDDADDNASVLATMNTLLLHDNLQLRTDAAATLHRLGQRSGAEALRRLAMHSDHRARIYVAQTVSQLGDQSFVPTLLRFLDDSNATVRDAALTGLPQLVGEDIGRSGLSQTSNVAQTQQMIDTWKAWGARPR